MIKDIRLKQVLNSCGKKTFRVILKTENGEYGAFAASGTSEGKYEAKSLDLDKVFRIFPRYKIKFIEQEEKNIDKIIEEIGLDKLGSHLSVALSIVGLRAVSNNKIYDFLNPGEKIFPIHD